jgi:hypothetical protein
VTLPATHNITVYRGDTYTETITYKEGAEGVEVGRTLAGATILAQIRTETGAASATASFTCTPDADQVTNPGKFVMTLPPAQSTLLTGTSYVYDVQVTWSDGKVQTLKAGTITVTQDVSRS